MIVRGIVDIGSAEEYNERRGIYVGICPFVSQTKEENNMGDKKSDQLHCPCCKRHCPFNDLHCSKGKVYVKSMKAKEDAVLQTKTYAPSFGRILLYYKLGFDRLFGQKDHKISGKKLRVLVMGALLKEDQKTEAQLKADTGMGSEKLKDCLEKLEKKEYIIKKKASQGELYFSLSGKGVQAAEDWIKEADKEVLSRLSEEERDQLEQLLKKLPIL